MCVCVFMCVHVCDVSVCACGLFGGPYMSHHDQVVVTLCDQPQSHECMLRAYVETVAYLVGRSLQGPNGHHQLGCECIALVKLSLNH